MGDGPFFLFKVGPIRRGKHETGEIRVAALPRILETLPCDLRNAGAVAFPPGMTNLPKVARFVI